MQVREVRVCTILLYYIAPHRYKKERGNLFLLTHFSFSNGKDSDIISTWEKNTG